MRTAVQELPLSTLDLETLEISQTPLFVVKVGIQALEFELLFANEAFRKADWESLILGDNRSALLFRSWVQALGDMKSEQTFAGVKWISELAGSRSNFKLVTAPDVASGLPPEYREVDMETQIKTSTVDHGIDMQLQPNSASTESKPRTDMTLFKTLPRTHLDARWEGIQSMLEMSDIGVFEYNARGELLHANDAWYRLR
jgi:hypothetical protein